MTVLVGALCEDGIVLGSDSSATFSSGQFATIEQPVQKTFVINDDVVIACTGSAGLGQRFHSVVQDVRSKANFREENRFAIASAISRSMIANMQQTFANPGQLGALVAFPSLEGFQLCEFALADFQPEFKTSEMWFVSMGSGQLITDPLFGLMRRVFFSGEQPQVNEGVFACAWALEHAIELNTGGINGPSWIAVLRQSSSKGYLAELLSNDQLAEHINNVRNLESYIQDYRKTISGDVEASPLPSPPVP